ncbi:MAG: cytochrome c biogenesis protein CcmE [Rhodospirillales bacterium 20-60-12]|jgi:cytochrome c-type biogenesis protein CcmE|nr:MAG: cytochrome c biogenesis protein CcmE [Rhodospirillales bacterium 20-60-12]OYV59335.1 MAG: cytochrome c biogenesis protein CcmE [Acidiphilium sp. 21-62-4]HQT66315.1 cytochrome c maturation protein CcmE [Acetobacteraceae bacterium]HQU02515.1 cytochrome c maturation protein CcmE [Acetobacteraceae bacterium]
MMTRKKRRLWLLVTCGIGVGSAVALTLAAFSSSLTYFLAPAQVVAKAPAPGDLFRLGGIVQAGSVSKTVTEGQLLTTFRVTDGRASIPVTYTGVLPDLFREGQGVVTIGSMAPGDHDFIAQEVLAKHGADYMPKAVEQALRESGKWNPKFGPPPPASTWNDMTVKKANG